MFVSDPYPKKQNKNKIKQKTPTHNKNNKQTNKQNPIEADGFSSVVVEIKIFN